MQHKRALDAGREMKDIQTACDSGEVFTALLVEALPPTTTQRKLLEREHAFILENAKGDWNNVYNHHTIWVGAERSYDVVLRPDLINSNDGEKNTVPKQNYARINEWKTNNTDRIQILPRKDERIPERIRIAIEQGIAESRQAYIIGAIKMRLESDGIPEISDEPNVDEYGD